MIIDHVTQATDQLQHDGPARRLAAETQVSLFDRISSLLVALLILVGFFVLILFLIWLTNRALYRERAVPVTLIEELAGRGDHALGTARDLEEPGVEELPDVVEPQLSETLEAVTDAVSSQAATLEALEGNAEFTGTGRGQGDSRMAGPGGEGSADIVPRWERWEVHFSTTSRDEYARQLDFFGIELGAVGGGTPNVDYATGLSKPTPSRRSAPGDQEKRLYMTWNSGVLQEMDRQLLEQAGITTRGRIIMQFYPPEQEQKLAELENAKAGGRSVKEIRKTMFGVRAAGTGYEFYVIDQQYRT